MNQILENKKAKELNKRLYSFQFFIFCFIILIFIIHLFWQNYSEKHVKKISESTVKNYNLTRLYSKNAESTIKANDNLISIIGTIEIPKINISYPIFSDYSNELLKISVCKFYGPDINTIGNFCIIGHNYNTSDFFSNLYLLESKDIINIYNSNRNMLSYEVYESYEVEPDNLSYLSQETNRRKRNNLSYMQ
ncbi:MAG: sortase [Clostridia bacterium]